MFLGPFGSCSLITSTGNENQNPPPTFINSQIRVKIARFRCIALGNVLTQQAGQARSVQTFLLVLILR